eukprot:855965-Ditylum_brightwellii.AAC.1
MVSISSLQVPIVWPNADTDVSKVTHLENPKEDEHWKTVETPKEITTYLKFQNSNSELEFLQCKLLKYCKQEQDAANKDEKVEIYKLKDKARTWNEQTTTSPSGKHLGHFKALLSHGLDNPKSDEGKDLRAKQDLL